MNALEYSDDAMNVLNIFHECDIMVYVEGVDDIQFWEVIFSHTSPFSVKIESTGGASELGKIVEKIELGEITAIAACDLDHQFPDSLAVTSGNVIYTYGHSIENTIICEHTIKSVIAAHAKTSKANVSLVALHLWRREFYSVVKELVLFDMANSIYKKGISVIGDNCSQFLIDRNSDRLSEDKLAVHVRKLRPNFKDVDFDEIENRILGSARDFFDYIRGHFLFSIFLKYAINKIKAIKSNASLSVDAFYASLIIAFDSVFNTEHAHFSYYSTSVEGIKI
jgi:hypothetical protein